MMNSTTCYTAVTVITALLLAASACGDGQQKEPVASGITGSELPSPAPTASSTVTALATSSPTDTPTLGQLISEFKTRFTANAEVAQDIPGPEVAGAIKTKAICSARGDDRAPDAIEHRTIDFPSADSLPAQSHGIRVVQIDAYLLADAPKASDLLKKESQHALQVGCLSVDHSPIGDESSLLSAEQLSAQEGNGCFAFVLYVRQGATVISINAGTCRASPSLDYVTAIASQFISIPD